MPLALNHTFRALRHRNYRLFFTGQGLSLIGTWLQQVAMGWLTYRLTGSACPPTSGMVGTAHPTQRQLQRANCFGFVKFTFRLKLN